MKNKIRQILREETSGFDENMLNTLYQYMNFLIRDYRWYYDTPEYRFEYTPESIWLINDETEEWVFELEKDGTLLWYLGFYENFKRYFNMERSDYEKFIKLWVEDVLNREASSTTRPRTARRIAVDDVLNRGVSSTSVIRWARNGAVEDVLNRGKELK